MDWLGIIGWVVVLIELGVIVIGWRNRLSLQHKLDMIEQQSKRHHNEILDKMAQMVGKPSEEQERLLKETKDRGRNFLARLKDVPEDFYTLSERELREQQGFEQDKVDRE